MLVAGIVGGDLRHQLGVELAPVGDLRPVERLEDAGLDLAAEEVVRRHDQIVAGATGEQLGLEDLVAVEDVVDHPDAGLGGEVFEHLRIDVVRPVVDLDHLVLGHGRTDREQCRGGDRGEGELAHSASPDGVPVPKQWSGHADSVAAIAPPFRWEDANAAPPPFEEGLPGFASAGWSG